MSDLLVPDCCTTPERPARRRYGHFLVYAFLISLAGCVNDVVVGTAAPRWLSGGALALFVSCFVVFVQTHPHTGSAEDAFSRHARGSAWLRYGALATLAIIAVATTLAYGVTWMVLFVFVVVTCAASLPLWLAPWSVAAVAATALIVNIATVRDTVTILTGVSWALSIVMAGFIALLLRRRGVLIAELRATQGEVARLAAADAVAEERLRFARDLHDLLGHSLSVIVLKAELARRLLERDEARAQARGEVVDLEQIARRALEEVREAVTGYRARSLPGELERSCDALEAAGIEVAVDVAPPELPPDVEALLAWVLRESTTNIVRHSRAGNASIEVAGHGDSVWLEVRDDGVGGGAPVELGAGLHGLVERVEAAGGRLEAGAAPGGGFAVTAEVPLGVARPLGAPRPIEQVAPAPARGAR